MRKYKNEKVIDRKGLSYLVRFSMKNGMVIGKLYRKNKYVGEFYGKTKKDVMTNINQNLNIIVYD